MMGRNYWKQVRLGRVKSGSVRPSAGFTIVETMIVLAVTGLIFVSVATMLAGRQRQTEFQQSIQNVQSQLQQIIGEVTNGYYPNGGDFSCNNGSVTPASAGLSSSQGASKNCIFVGKIIHFYTSNAGNDQFYVYPVLGQQSTSSGVIVDDLGQSQPKLLADSTTGTSGGNFNGELATYQLLYGLTLKWMHYGDSGQNTGSVGFVSLGNGLTSAPSGAVQVNLLPIEGGGSSITKSSDDEIDYINRAFFSPSNYSSLDGMLNPDGGVQLCFVSGGTDQSGLVTIGGAGRVLNVTLQIMGGTSC